MNRSRLWPACFGVLLLGSPLWADEPDLSAYRAGTLDDDAVRESSGLVCAGGPEDMLWTHNDGGNGAWLYRLNGAGNVIERVEVSGARNVDWEDLAVLRDGGEDRLVIADIGDNFARRSQIQLLVTNAMDPARSGPAEIIQTLSIRYPDGARDSEAIAIDGKTATVWLIAKRTIPAEVYTISLDRQLQDGVVTAEYVGQLDTLPQPDREDIALAPIRQDWFWQPTALDFSPDGGLAAVLTYEAIYLYERDDGESWWQAFQTAPRKFALGKGWVAEALCLTSEAVYWTTEGQRPPLFRIPLADSRWERLD